MRRKLALREKWCGLVGRACAQGVRDRMIIVRRAKAAVQLHRLFSVYKTQHNMQAMSLILRSFMRRDRFRALLHARVPTHTQLRRG
jgi:hypothetical protein